RHLDDRRDPGAGTTPTVHACIIAQPVGLMALLHLAAAENATQVELASGRPLPVLDPQDEGAIDQALGTTPGILLHGVGLFVPAATLDRALNRVERLEQDAQVALALRALRRANA